MCLIMLTLLYEYYYIRVTRVTCIYIYQMWLVSYRYLCNVMYMINVYMEYSHILTKFNEILKINFKMKF